jgi:hypothetical protein
LLNKGDKHPSPRRSCFRKEDQLIAHDTHVYGEVDSKTGMKKGFKEVRRDVEEAKSRPEDAKNVRFHAGKLPAAYRAALQDVR